MRRPVTLAMSGLTAVVTGIGMWTSAQSPTQPLSTVAAGVVQSGPVTVVATPSPTASATVTGHAASTRYGDVQVKLVIAAGRIVRATAVAYPRESHRDQEINAYAVPVLEQASVSAQSAQIDTVSGATYTSDGYVTSLQSALDAAHQAGAL